MADYAGKRYQDSHGFRDLAYRAFQKADRDQSGSIDVKELHIALLLLYDKMNTILPVHMPVPDRQEVRSPVKQARAWLWHVLCTVSIC